MRVSFESRYKFGVRIRNVSQSYTVYPVTIDPLGRMKPDLVAPGVSVLTAYAHENGKTVQVYGTSFSGPVVAGNAALVRQYFEEGKLPCSWGNCKIDPSGSL